MDKDTAASTLPPKELSLFKRIVKYYDQKQYKTGLKFANQILNNPKFADHGETLSMKGILLNCLGKKEEARELVKRGLQSNIKSFVCWHIFGLIKKSDRLYYEAIRAYIQALRLDPKNLQVLRDLSVLQMHIRDLDGCLETRSKLLTERPTQKASWVGYTVVQHLRGQLDTAATVIREFLKENKQYEEAVNFMIEHAKEIVDKVSYLETYGKASFGKLNFIIADLLLNLGSYDDAEKTVWELLERNPDCVLYYEIFYKIAEAKNKCEMSLLDKRKMLKECIDKFSYARLPKLLFLDTLEGDEFSLHVDLFMRKNLRKGVPNLFIQLKRFYNNEERIKTLETLYLTYRSNLDAHNTLGPISHGMLGSNEPADASIEPPSSSLWLNYLIAQHFNYMGQTQRALDVITEEIKTNPTIVDLYTLKAEIYRDAGDVITASKWMDDAQALDTADRFINAQCTKCMVQAHRIADAEVMAAKFTRGSTTATQYLTEMQCMWFLIENARSYWAMQKYGEALKYCHEIDRVYTAILEDQLDFHSYCLRKGTLRSYIETIRLEDKLRDHPAYFDAACLAVEIYLYLHVNPLGAENDEDNQQNSNLSSSELKKLRNKQRKAQLRAEANKEEQKKREHQNHQRKDKNEDPENRPPEVEILQPRKLARPENALNEAVHFLQPLIELSGNRIETHCLAYEVFERKGKLLLMLRAIRRGLEVPGAEDHPWFNECLCRFLLRMAEMNPEEDNLVHVVLFQQAKVVFGESLPKASETNDAFLKRNAKSFMHVFRGILTKAIIEPKSAEDAYKKLPSPSDKEFGTVSWKVLFDAMELLKRQVNLKLSPVTSEMNDKFRSECSTLYPLAAVFYDEAKLEAHRKAVLSEPSSVNPEESEPPKTPNSKISPSNNAEVDSVAKRFDGLAVSSGDKSSNGGQGNKMNGHVETLISGKGINKGKKKKAAGGNNAKANTVAARN
nr:n alpha acetyltransferase 15 NatA auxiliary [Hymenolepis microstoma]